MTETNNNLENIQIPPADVPFVTSLSKNVILLALLILIGVVIFLGIRLNGMTGKMHELESASQTSSKQLANLNTILGHALDTSKPDVINSNSMGLQASLEVFQKMTELLEKVNDLTISPNALVTSEEKINTLKSPIPEQKKSVNAEMRWWGKVFHEVMVPAGEFFKGLVKIQVMDSPVDALAITPLDQKLLQDEVTLRILTARQLLLSGRVKEAGLEMRSIKKSATFNFAVAQPKVEAFMDLLDEVIVNLNQVEKTVELSSKESK